MKILLIKPYLTINSEDSDTYGFFPPIGLAYIASVLEKKGFTVKIIDCQLGDKQISKDRGPKSVRVGMSDKKIIEEIKTFLPQVIGVSSNFTCFAVDPMNIAKLIKDTYTDVLLVMGGAHATIAYREILEKGHVDVVVKGDGEITFLELAEKIRNKEEYGNVKGIAKLDVNGEIINNPPREPIMNLDELPFPAYHLLDMDKYIYQRDKNFAFYMDYPFGFIMSSRGCPYNCIFCSTSKFFKKYRERSAVNINDEIEFLIENYNIKEIHFLDDNFNVRKKRVELICNEMMSRKLKVSWQVSQGVNIANIDERLLRLMARSGLYRIGFSIESGSEKTLKYIRKPIDLGRSLKIIMECNRLGIYTHGNFIIGFPYETKEEIDKTIDYIMGSSLDYVKLLICQPLAGADLYDSYKETGLFNGTPRDGSNYLHTLYDTKYMKAKELNKLRKTTVRKFLLRKILISLTPNEFKLIIFPKITSMKRILYFTKVVYNIFKLMLLRKTIA